MVFSDPIWLNVILSRLNKVYIIGNGRHGTVLIKSIGYTRTSPRKKGPLVEMAAFKETPYTLFTIDVFLCLWAVYLPYDYVRILLVFENAAV
jgi:hypothetical protein